MSAAAQSGRRELREAMACRFKLLPCSRPILSAKHVACFVAGLGNSVRFIISLAVLCLAAAGMCASAAAQQTGLPVCVEVMALMPCRSMMAALPAIAEMGSELEIPLPNSARSGTMP